MQRKTSASWTDSPTAATGVPGVDREPGEAAKLADGVQRAVDVRRGLGMEGDRVRPSLGELLDVILGAVDHQVDVDRAAGLVDLVGDRARDERADRDRGDEVAVHHVHVDDPRAGGHHLLDLGAEAGEVRGENRGRDAPAAVELTAGGRRLVGGGLHRPPQMLRSIECPQCWHCMSSVRLMRAIVWCSPQFGHWETSSNRRRQ